MTDEPDFTMEDFDAVLRKIVRGPGDRPLTAEEQEADRICCEEKHRERWDGVYGDQ